jgi:hypothetical protein
MILQLNFCGLCASVEINTVTNLFSHLPFIFVYNTSKLAFWQQRYFSIS